MTDEDEFRVVEEFPQYEVNRQGVIRSFYYKDYVMSKTWVGGNLKVTFSRRRGGQTSRLAKRVVAEAFCVKPPRRGKEQLAVICKDNNPENLTADNLAWRTKSFAWHYARQFQEPRSEYLELRPVINTTTGEIFTSIFDCGVSEGTLFKDIHRSIVVGVAVPPTQSRYKFGEI